MFEQVEEWSSSDDVFLSKDKVHNELFVVLDNTAWLQAANNRPATSFNYQDVAYELNMVTTYRANDFYQKAFLAFMVSVSTLAAVVWLMACLIRM